MLYFSGATDTLLNRLYPPPVYEMPGDVLFELTGILQFVVAIGLTYYLVRLWNERSALQDDRRHATQADVSTKPASVAAHIEK